jgi:branched-chain amino acid transport system substrate-binding protein
MMVSKRGAVRTAAAGFALTALVAACGSSGGSSGGSSTTSTGPQPTKSPIKIGLLASLTGTGGPSVKYSANVVQAWAKWANATQNGVNGHPVTIVVKDSKSDPAAATSAAQALINTDKVDLLLLGDPTTELAAGKFLSASGTPIMGFGYTPIWNTAPNFFATSAVIPLLYTIQPTTTAAVGAKAFGSIACAEVPTCSSGAAAYIPAAQAVGVKYTGLIKASSTAASYTAECLKLMQKGTDYIEATFASATVIRIAQNCSQQGFKGWIGLASGSTVAKDFKSASGVKFAGSIWATPWWSDSAGAKTFRDAMTQYNAGNDYEDANSSAFWAALEVFRKAGANLGDTVSRQTLMDALYTTQNETLGGLLAQPVTFTKGKPSPVINCMFLYKLENGKFTTASFGNSGNGQSGDLQSTCFPPKK